MLTIGEEYIRFIFLVPFLCFEIFHNKKLTMLLYLCTGTELSAVPPAVPSIPHLPATQPLKALNLVKPSRTPLRGVS